MQLSFIKTGDIWQWDRNRRLICANMADPTEWQVHISVPCDEEGAYVLLPYRDSDGTVYVNIPNILLQSPHDRVDVYACHMATEEKQTKTHYQFRVKKREMPADYVYTETETWDWQAIAQAEEARGDAEEARATAESQRNEAEAARAAAEQDRETSVRLTLEEASRVVSDAAHAAETAREAAQNVRDGTSVGVASVTESTESGGENITTFTDGTTLTVRNGQNGARGASGLLPLTEVPYAPSVTAAANTVTRIGKTEGALALTLGTAVSSYDNEWVFVITQGETAYDIVLPVIHWPLGIAPTFSENSTTKVHLFYVGDLLYGVWNV